MGLDPQVCAAVWVHPTLVLLPDAPRSAADWTLHASDEGGIDPDRREPVPWRQLPLSVVPGPPPPEVLAEHPHLAGATALRLPVEADPAALAAGQLALIGRDPRGAVVAATGVQIGPLLDALFPDPAAPGVEWRGGVPTLRLWAPTARAVAVLLWLPGAGEEPRRVPATRDADGTWRVVGEPGWRDAAYLYAVTVYAPDFDRVVENRVTDPYAVALTTDSAAGVLADPDDPRWAEPRWLAAPSPPLRHPVDQVSYELHVRDFSREDTRVPAELRGSYAAFGVEGHGRAHLRRLAEAGLTSVQLLPVHDFASVPERADDQASPDPDALAALPPDSPEQQRLAAHRPGSPFNWGYDPWHFFAPEGSYATAGGRDGGARIAELRGAVGALHELGLRVVLDVVFNHTRDAGQQPASVLDKIVPGYYHRRALDGRIATSTAGPSVATERAMAARLVTDAAVHWARHYRIDGFRFDLMGHHGRDVMVGVRAALDALTLADDGVDGRAVTLHGEGWDFGEVAGNARFVQATQGQLDATGIATVSDRLRDAVRGGAPFDADPRRQGWASGLAGAPNGAASNGGSEEQAQRLLAVTDIVQVGLAGTLRSFRFRSARTGRPTRGDEVGYVPGRAAGYASEPAEALNYVDAHDNETLFDALAHKLPPDTDPDQRARAHLLALGVATLGQNPVLWHAGVELLRSKSLDRNSYDSGDWFNVFDVTGVQHGFGRGLPPSGDNRAAWSLAGPLLADPSLKPSPALIASVRDRALDWLRLRRASRLFRLGSTAAIAQKLSFPASGTWAQRPGVIVMLLDDERGIPVGEDAALLLVANALPWPIRQSLPPGVGVGWELHPVQAAGADPVVRHSRVDDATAVLPGRTLAVFRRPRP